MSLPPETPDRLVEAVEALHDRYDQIEVAERTIRLETPVNGDAGSAALRMLAIAQGAFPVGVAAHGPGMVAIGVWSPPDLYLARWTQNRWVVGYRLPKGSKPGDYISEGRIPSRLETGNWYASIPDQVGTAFLEVGLSLESPPFPPPKVIASPSKKTATRAPRKPPSRPAPSTTAARPAAPRKAEAAPKPPPPPTTRVCSGCNMRRALTQFTPGSDLCVDCR